MKLARRKRRTLWVLFTLVLLYAVLGFFVVPPIARSQIETRLSALLGRRVTVETVRFNPFALSVTLENFAVRDRDNTTLFLGWEKLYANFELLASIPHEWVLRRVELTGFTSRVVVNPDQSLNFSDILDRLAAMPMPRDERQSRPVRIDWLAVSNARVDFTDRSRRLPFESQLGPVTFAVTNLHTAGPQGAPYRFEAVTESGEKLAWSGTIHMQPLGSSGELDLDGIVLAKYAPYYADLLNATVTDGKVSLHAGYEAIVAGDQRVMKLHDGSVQLRALKLLEPISKQPVLELPSLDVQHIEADALAPRASIGSISLTGGHVVARRDEAGRINLLELAAAAASPKTPTTSGTPAAGTASPAAAKPLDITVADFAANDLRVDWHDASTPRPLELSATGVSVALHNASLAPGTHIPMQVALNWAPQGRVSITGNVALSPLSADLDVGVDTLALAPLSPYLEQFAAARLTSGALTTKLSVHGKLAEGSPLSGAATGDVSIEHLGLFAGPQDEKFAGFSALRLQGIDVKLAPAPVGRIARVEWSAPSANFVINHDKTLNLEQVLHPSAAGAEKSTNDRPPKPDVPAATVAKTGTPLPVLPKFDVGELVITEGEFHFSDRSLEPNVNVAVTGFTVKANGLSTTGTTPADLTLTAAVDGAGPLTATGKLGPIGPQLAADLKVDTRNVNLVPLSPYAARFAGYELASGSLALDVKLRVQSERLDSANVITLNQFTFGNHVNSPDATHLPVRLGVALLKDREGRIVLNVPVQGSLADPNFQVAGVVGHVIGNLLAKAATSPFSLLGAAFGGGGEELGFQEFAPGSADLQPTERKKLDTLVRALTDRPALTLLIEGSYNPSTDRDALQEAKLAQQVREFVWRAQSPNNASTPPPDTFGVTPEQSADAIRALYTEKFPGNAAPAAAPTPAPAAPKPSVASVNPERRRGFFRHVLDVITFRRQRLAHAERREAKREQAEAAAAARAAATSEANETGNASNSAGPSLDQMSAALADAIAVSDDELRELAQTRAQRVYTFFNGEGKIPAERLTVAKPQANAPPVKGAKVVLTLQ